MTTSPRYSPEVRERAVRMVLEHQSEYPSQWQAIRSLANKCGCTPETLRKWHGRPRSIRVGEAAIDRVVHNSVILELNLPSYRLEESKKKAKQQS